MAKRPYFFVKDGMVLSENVEFTWYPGFSISQKQKCISSMHEAIGKHVLEISSASNVIIGRSLSAFSLRFEEHILENVFQSSKCFEKGGPYRDLLAVTAKEAKHDPRLKESGQLRCFVDLDGDVWELETKTAYYDYLYVYAVWETLFNEQIKKVCEYDAYTDIMFNPVKSMNTQARSIAIVKLMFEMFNDIPGLSKKEFLEFHKKYVSN